MKFDRLMMNIAMFALSAGTAGAINAANIVQHQDAASLATAISQSQFEDFEDSTLLSGLSISGSGSISGGRLYRFVQPTRASVFTFSEAVFGLGGEIISAGFGSLELTLTFTDGTSEILSPFAVGPDRKRYLGFSSDVGITSLSFRSATAATVQFYLDDLTYGAAPAVAAVPEPASWALMIGGLGIVGGAIRRRTRSAVQFA